MTAATCKPSPEVPTAGYIGEKTTYWRWYGWRWPFKRVVSALAIFPAMMSIRSRWAVSAEPEMRMLLKRPIDRVPAFRASAAECASGEDVFFRAASPGPLWLLVLV